MLPSAIGTSYIWNPSSRVVANFDVFKVSLLSKYDIILHVTLKDRTKNL